LRKTAPDNHNPRGAQSPTTIARTSQNIVDELKMAIFMPEPLISNHTGEITQLLARFRQGDAEAAGRLLPIVYDALRNQARSQFRNERANHTLQPTALVFHQCCNILSLP
jgi:hypothetical protein